MPDRYDETSIFYTLTEAEIINKDQFSMVVEKNSITYTIGDLPIDDWRSDVASAPIFGGGESDVGPFRRA